MKLDNILLLNKTTLGYRKMSISESLGFVNMKSEKYQLPTNFYGNQVANLAKTCLPGIYLCVDRRNGVFDILVKKDEISALTPAEIRDILDAKRIVYAKQMPKKTLLSLLGIEYNPTKDADDDNNGDPDKDPNNANNENEV